MRFELKIFVSFSGAESKTVAPRTPCGFLMIIVKQRGDIQCDITYTGGMNQ